MLLAHADSHYSVARAAGICGSAADQVVRVGLDERGRMDPALLEAELTRVSAEGRPVVAVGGLRLRDARSEPSTR